MKRRHVAPFWIACLFWLIADPLPIQAQPAAFRPTDALNIDPKVTVGKFKNGLTYYIRQNQKPERRAELRLVVKAGSVLEDDDQQGLAHFVEHMAFNGTKSFPKTELITFMESVGMRLGPDINAYTSFEETVYMLQVPTDSAHVMEKGFQILGEWAHAVTFDHEEIDKERGVVGEEWRLGKGAFERVNNKHYPVIFYNSQYARRLPIGKKEVLDTAHYDALKRFYRDWYRPELMAVIAVGDFDKRQVEALIRKNFEGLKNPPKPRPVPKYTIPDHTESLVSVATDRELPYANVQILFKRPAERVKTVTDYRRRLVGSLYDGMVNARLQERMQKPDPPFAFVQSGNFRFVGGTQAYAMSGIVKEEAIARAVEELLNEAFRVKQHGFVESELERQKAEQIRRVEKAYDEREKTESRNFVSEYTRHFLQDEPIPGIETELALYRQLVPTITLAEVNALAAERLTPNNRVATVSAPEKEGLKIPGEGELLSLLASAGRRQLEAYVDRVTAEPLLATLPKPGTVASERHIDALGVTEWRLSNGAIVVLKPTDFKNDEVLFSAYSRGGTSLSSDDEFHSARFSAEAVRLSGVGEFDAIALQKMLAGKVVNVSPTIGELSEGFNGSASPKDLETLFQLVHLYFTSPRKDSSAVDAFLTRQRALLQSRGGLPEFTFFDTVTVTLSSYHFRGQPVTAKTLDEVSVSKAHAFFRDRFADASDFIFFFVGAFTPETIKPLVEQYLASLPALHRKESWRDVGIRRPEGTITKAVYKGVEPKSIVQMFISGPFEWSIENRYALQSVVEYLRIRLREVLREDKGGVYGVQVGGTPSLHPRQEYSVAISFGCAPDRVDELVNEVLSQIDSVKTVTPDESHVMRVKEIQRREREVNLKENRFWITQLRTYYSNDEDPRIMLQYDKLVEGLTGEAIRSAAHRYLDLKNFVKLVLYPEKQ